MLVKDFHRQSILGWDDNTSWLTWRFSFPSLCSESCCLSCAMLRHAPTTRFSLGRPRSARVIQHVLQRCATAARKHWMMEAHQTAITIAAKPTLDFCSAHQKHPVSFLAQHYLQTAERPRPPYLASLAARWSSRLPLWISLFSNHEYSLCEQNSPRRYTSAALLER